MLHTHEPIFKTKRIDVYFISYKCNMNSKNDNDRFPIIYCLKYPYFSRSLSVQYMCYYLTLSRISTISPSESGSLSSFVDNKCIVIDYVRNFRSSIKIAKTKVFVLCTKYRGITNNRYQKYKFLLTTKRWIFRESKRQNALVFTGFNSML